ncbi:hypothetical protein CcaverHIS002_0110070 [Cutaneotrichosporon cavernicola]|uniref:Uncharacterized protein n=1 Tax=Cutaneotrichosporon cavernicola TaxID=279322 RepID=A0AA48L295_9TREE|nr:uncharacterized protein CcaverHIS019_0110010 [Cutaneotrichosporon cavernicola]BEI80478.1 hypothetical protein CcaverHIS002_0110070 [Cutaneotrichosporon cavernicola]BEI88283.1 hypothetical protein CcaverHIS019_0110010 [Cutaneotrichosporon cavernicola]BEI96055.1 hypothetical protein CcaverHIS631_0110040 [Cutaneotrichosporon cavernicola]BEJ03827.1 hypothetical protein CcaverHIS641_0110020 [Cutaneotrichosporon cavernicola]
MLEIVIHHFPRLPLQFFKGLESVDKLGPNAAGCPEPRSLYLPVTSSALPNTPGAINATLPGAAPPALRPSDSFSSFDEVISLSYKLDVPLEIRALLLAAKVAKHELCALITLSIMATSILARPGSEFSARNHEWLKNCVP